MKKFNRVLSLALALVMIISLLPAMSAVAQETEPGMTFTASEQYQLEKSFSAMPRTMEAWVKFDPGFTARGGCIIGNYNVGRPDFVFEINTSGAPRLFVQFIDDAGNDVFIDVKFQNVNVCTGEYVHVALVINDVKGSVGTISCYMNGELKQTKAPQYAVPKDLTFSAPLIGGDLRDNLANPQYFKGELKGVALYEDVRTAAEVKADMTALAPEGLMAAWDLTGQQGAQTLKDISGNGHNASLPMTFTQTGMYQAVKGFPSMPRTIETWFKFDKTYAARSGSVIGNYNSGRPNLTVEFNASGQPRFYMQDANGKATIDLRFTSVPSVYTGKWVHVAFAIDDAAGKIHCYVDGVLKESKDAVIPTEISASPMVLGGDLRTNNEQWFKGQLKSVAAYTDMRTAEEIAADLYAPGEEDLMAYWVTAGNLGANAIYDESGNGYHAMLKTPTPVTNEGGMTFDGEAAYKTQKQLNVMPHTIEAEIYVPADLADDQRGGVIVGNYGAGDMCINLEVFTDGIPRFYVEYEGDKKLDCRFDNVDLRTGEWTHLTIVVNDAAGTLDCYVNGFLAQSKVQVVEDVICNNVIALGGDLRSGNERYFVGGIKSLALFADARTPSEIKADMASMTGVRKDDLVASWNMEGLNEPQQIEDNSGNGYTVKRYTTWFSEKEPVTDYSYSMVVVGDTQKVAYADVTNGTTELTKLYDWILANRESKNIQYVMGMGDITDKNLETEWSYVYDLIAQMDGQVGYSLVRGNHDGSERMNETFNKGAYAASIEGSFDGGIENTWRTLTVGQVKYLIMTLDYGASDAVLKWANQVVEEHPEYNVIITTHAYLFRDGTTLDKGDVCPPSTSGGCNDGDHLWEKLVSKHSNIVLVLSGHDPCDRVVMAQDTGDHGNVVTQILVDPQGVDAAQGSTGMITMLYFSEDGKNVQVETYSTIKEQYFMTENQFSFTLDVVEETDDTTPAQKPAVPSLVDFSSVAEAWEAFDLYSTSSGGFTVRDGKLVPGGLGGEFKAIYKGNGSPISSVTVDIYPNGEAGLINGGLYIGASDAANGQDQISALYVGVESNMTGWEDAPNRVDLVIGKFPAWAALDRVTSETGNGNNLFTGGVKQPLTLRVDICGDTVTATLSLKSDPTKSICTTYTADRDLSQGQVGIRSQHNDAMYDDFSVVNAVAAVGNRYYGTLAEAVTNAEDAVITVLANSDEQFTVTGNTTIDLAGFHLTGVIAAEGSSLKIVDSAATYEQTCGSAVVVGSVEIFAENAGRNYLTVGENDVYSAHPYSVKLTHISLDPTNDALGYKAELIGDDVVKVRVQSIGFNLWVDENRVITKTLSGKTQAALRLKNILACNGGEVTVNGSAFVVFDNQQIVTSATHSTTMKQVLQIVDSAWNTYSPDQQNAVLDLCNRYLNVVEKWELNNILFKEEN